MTEMTKLQFCKLAGPDTELARRNIWFGRCFLLYCLLNHWSIVLYSDFFHLLNNLESISQFGYIHQYIRKSSLQNIEKHFKIGIE